MKEPQHTDTVKYASPLKIHGLMSFTATRDDPGSHKVSQLGRERQTLYHLNHVEAKTKYLIEGEGTIVVSRGSREEREGVVIGNGCRAAVPGKG